MHPKLQFNLQDHPLLILKKRHYNPQILNKNNNRNQFKANNHRSILKIKDCKNNNLVKSHNKEIIYKMEINKYKNHKVRIKI